MKETIDPVDQLTADTFATIGLFDPEVSVALYPVEGGSETTHEQVFSLQTKEIGHILVRNVEVTDWHNCAEPISKHKIIIDLGVDEDSDVLVIEPDVRAFYKTSSEADEYATPLETTTEDIEMARYLLSIVRQAKLELDTRRSRLAGLVKEILSDLPQLDTTESYEDTQKIIAVAKRQICTYDSSNFRNLTLAMTSYCFYRGLIAQEDQGVSEDFDVYSRLFGLLNIDDCE
jgi:hypothetical protein